MLVEVVAYDSSWPKKFEEEKEKIKQILGDNYISCHHIGSTSVEGLHAKPVIDIMPIVKDISKVDTKINAFNKIGYECLGENGIVGRRFFRKGEKKRTHHIHVFEESSNDDIKRHLAVRDYLRTHPNTCKEYARLKLILAQKYYNDIDRYCNGKDSFVKRMEQEALKWYMDENK